MDLCGHTSALVHLPPQTSPFDDLHVCLYGLVFFGALLFDTLHYGLPAFA
jgi:hypothetical protein